MTAKTKLVATDASLYCRRHPQQFAQSPDVELCPPLPQALHGLCVELGIRFNTPVHGDPKGRGPSWIYDPLQHSHRIV